MPTSVDTQKSLASHQRLAHLDGIRGLAILSVISLHWGSHVFPGLFTGGSIGVDAFLVLSGYLITSLLLRRTSQPLRSAYPSFLWARTRRLYPALLGLVAGVFIVQTLGFGLATDRQPALMSYVTTTLSISWIAGMVATLDPSQWITFGHTWSLGVEWAFYLVWPFALWAVARRRPDWRVLAAATAFIYALTALLLPDLWMYASPIGRSVELIAGGALALAHATRDVNPNPSGIRTFLGRVLVVAALIAMGGWVLFGAGALSPGFRFGCMPIATIGTLVLIAVSSHDPLVQKLLAFRPLSRIGLVSYSLYLWHQPIGLWFQPREDGLSPLAAAGLTVVATATVSIVSFVLLERPYFRSQPRPASRP